MITSVKICRSIGLLTDSDLEMKSLYSVPRGCKDGTSGKSTQDLSFGKPSEHLQPRRKAASVPSDLFRAGFPIRLSLQLSICDSAADSSMHLKFLSML